MTSSSRIARWVAALGLGAALGVGLGADPAAAQEKPWSQEEVTATARELREAVGDLRETARQRGGGDVASMQARARHRLDDTLRLIENESRHLGHELEGGGDMEATLWTVRRLMSLVRDAQDDARKVAISQPAQEQIAKAREILGRLAAYYPTAE
jgi:hypothetical protein